MNNNNSCTGNTNNTKNDTHVTLEELKREVMQFVDEREWRQFHTPKNVATALACEAGELLDFFLWTKDTEPQEPLENHRTEIEHEVADIFAYLLAFCAENNIDLATVLREKMELNRKKYPVELSKNNKAKYTYLRQEHKKS